MLCAPDELGLSDDHHGLLDLGDEPSAGTPLSEVLGPPETVLDLEITPNRPDCLSLIGIARELAALYGVRWKRPPVNCTGRGTPAINRTSVDVQDPFGCPRYTARVAGNVQVRESPAWMQRRLRLAGIRPINNIVDITNYVMLETGHPLHAFDQSFLREGRIVVRLARPGERIRTLDGVDRALEPDMLVIADAERAVAVAGIMGGAGSEIRETTRTVLLESAGFDAPLIRSTSRRLGLLTESSYRFERGVDAAGAEWASRRAAALMAELADADIAPGVIDIYPRPPASRTLTVRYERVDRLLGIPVRPAEVRHILTALELPMVGNDGVACMVEIPTFRGDLEREVDLIEEVARIHGLDQIPANPPRAELALGAEDRDVRETARLRDLLAALGLQEIMNYSYVADGLLDRFGLDLFSERVRLPHPLSQDHSVMRTSLTPQMVESLGRNAARQVQRAAFFEMGRSYHREASGRHREEHRVAIGLWGAVGRSDLHARRPVSAPEMFAWVKGLWEGLADGQRIGDWTFSRSDHSVFQPGFGVSIRIGDRETGRLGILRSAIAKEWRMLEPVGIFESLVEPLLRAFRRSTVEPVAAFPAVVRDVALIVDNTVTHQHVLQTAHQAAPKELESVCLFDIFSGEGIGNGKKSLAYSFTYRSSERTLTDEEANQFHDRIKAALQKELDARIRDH
jgi:phenylalanyl-tRNA synthetase beta chain